MAISQHQNITRRSLNQGFTLMEIMIALFIGLFMLGIVSQVALSAHTANKNISNLADLQETGRFAMEIIEKDLQRAGYYGGNANVKDITGSAGIVINGLTTCTGDSWGRMLQQHIYGLNNSRTGYDCISADEYLRGDILTIRYADTVPAQSFVEKNLYLRSSLFEGRLFFGKDESAANNTNLTKQPQTVHNVVARSYFIGQSARSCNNTAVPALFWKNLVDGVPSSEELLSGIEQMQFEYGVDTDNSGVVNQYLTANNVTNWDDVVVVKAFLLVRSACPDSDFKDTKTYNIGDLAYQPNDNFQRQLFTTSIALRNLLNNAN